MLLAETKKMQMNVRQLVQEQLQCCYVQKIDQLQPQWQDQDDETYNWTHTCKSQYADSKGTPFPPEMKINKYDPLRENDQSYKLLKQQKEVIPVGWAGQES